MTDTTATTKLSLQRDMNPPSREGHPQKHELAAVAAIIVVGILILVVGLYILFTRLTTLLAPSYANVGFLIVGIILLAIGAKVISSKS